MNPVSIRMSNAEKERLENMAKSNNKTLSNLVRELLFSDASVQSKIDFYSNISSQINALQKQGAMTNQMVYQLLVKNIGETETENLVEQIEKYVME
ncbi:DUF6290 family protein [Pectinatus frisingensis]|uniref:DUF6290 family protein n=1 Tax=Pectinatus frisingensis TaxID=865 RepID=UPI0018C57D33|nr:DUF6290 family protein [Pectinatus frisingensis]